MKAHEVEEWGARMRARACENFNERGKLPPHAIFLATRVPTTGEPLPHPTTVPFFPEGYDGTELHKDMLSTFLTSEAKRSGSIALIFISEAWFLKEQMRGVETVAQAKKHAYRHGPSLEQHPDRMDVLMASFQRLCVGKTEVYIAEINRDGKRARVDQFELLPGNPIGGRFSGNLEPAN